MNDQPPQRNASFGAWLSTRRNFIWFAILAGGGATLVVVAAMVRPSRPLDWIVLSSLCFGGGYVWGFIMWHFFEAKRKEWAARGKRDA